MNKLLLPVLSLCLTTSLFAQIEKSVTSTSGPAGSTTKLEWKKDRKLLLTQTLPENGDVSLCMIRLGDSGTDLSIWIRDGRVTGISSQKTGFLFSLDDFTKDGVPDFLQIKSPDSGKVSEAFTITEGKMEPLPEDKYRKDREEFYFDEDIVEYLKKKK